MLDILLEIKLAIPGYDTSEVEAQLRGQLMSQSPEGSPFSIKSISRVA